MDENNTKITGVLVFYVDIGNLPTKKGVELVESFKERFRDFTTKMKANNYEVIWVPNRYYQGTHVELLKL